MASLFIKYNEIERKFYLKTTTVYIEVGSYQLQIKLVNKLGQSSLYAFDFDIVCPIEQPIDGKFDPGNYTDDSDGSSKFDTERVKPSFKLEELNYLGQLDIKFTQEMVIPNNITEINSDILMIKLVADESNIVDNEKDLDFKWYITSFTKDSMSIQIEFLKPEYISMGLIKDNLVVEVKNPKYFFSSETF